MLPKQLPKRLGIIGSGAIGIEFASFYNDLGSKVSVFEMQDRICPTEDHDISVTLEKILTKKGAFLGPITRFRTSQKTRDIM